MTHDLEIIAALAITEQKSSYYPQRFVRVVALFTALSLGTF